MKHKPEIPKNYPAVDKTGWYSTFDILKIFSWKRGLIKNWIEEKYIEPKATREDKRGKTSYFAGFQLYTIRIFKQFLNMGIPRRSASQWAKFIENKILKKNGHLNPERINFAVFELKNGQLINVDFFEDPKGIKIDWKDDSNDFYVLNFKRLIDEVDALS